MYLFLLFCGDIELNPGPVLPYRSLYESAQKLHDNLKVININCRSLVKYFFLQNLVNDIGTNCIYGLTETWLTENDLSGHYLPHNSNFSV